MIIATTGHRPAKLQSPTPTSNPESSRAGCLLGGCVDEDTCAFAGRCCADCWHTPTRCPACGHVYDAAACEDDNCPACGSPCEGAAEPPAAG
jgi:hypothetical protein